jgi:hypothetical protein
MIAARCAAVVALGLATVAAQSWKAPRLPDGHPDFQGVWSNNTVTPFVRPKALAGREFLADDEIKTLQQRAAVMFNGDGDTAPGDAMFEALIASPNAFTKTGTGDYNQVWASERLVFEHRTSQLIDPSSGTLPPLSREGARRHAAFLEARRLHPADGPEDRAPIERCLSAGPIKLGFVQTRNNSYYQIVQTVDTTLLYTEMMRDARLIHMDGRPHPPSSIHSWAGDSRGRWEGDALVIDTTNYHPQAVWMAVAGVLFSAEHFHVAERLTQLDDQTLQYRVTVEDPTLWTQPWSAVTTWRRSSNRIFEYACHEGNRAMEGVLRGARAEEGVAKQPD